MIIDPSLGVVARKPDIPEVDLIILSHAHEDHVAGMHLYPDAKVFIHHADAPGVRSLQGLIDIYGFTGEQRNEFAITLMDDFFFRAREHVFTFSEGDRFDLGGVELQVLHTPGHTRGHCCFLITWDGSDDKFVYLGDIELTGFGPYYGDVWSDLEDFEQSLERLRHLEADWWLTFHHKGLIESREAFLPMLEAFAGMIDDREQRLLEFIKTPRTIEEIVEHRFVYRPGTGGIWVDHAEKRSMSMHLDRLIRQGKVRKEGDSFQVV